ncbi:hypothetical protein COO60DRAFT_1217443 [Scenedesmus sp. NREL 46B-D3]|nr:hypothetical protein COO60DRAFT_1217443 [Scenedesmus sp. NREL 46B-D3]
MTQLNCLKHALLGRMIRSSTAELFSGLESTSSRILTSCKSAEFNSCRPFSTHATNSTSSSNYSSTLRRVNIKNNTGGAAAAGEPIAAEAVTSTSGQGSGLQSLLEMSTEVPGGSKPLRRWEYYYWGLGVSVVSYFLYRNLAKPEETPEQIEAKKQKAAELEVRRKEHVRAAIMGQNFIEGEADPLEGLTPAQIVKFMEIHKIDPSDPLEGLTPEEIDAYVHKQEAARQEREEQ